MRAFEFLKEADDISQLKTKIINTVKNSSDDELIQKLYTTINKTGLFSRIAPILSRDTDTKGYVDNLVNIIIEVPGTYEEKQAFIKGYPTGYIDIEKMLSGDYVKFDNLITGGEGTPVEFVKKVFNALKQVTFGGAKGPGEFGLAVLSPYIKITGKGDLNIGDKTIEVKAAAGEEKSSGGGRIGTPGLLSTDNIPSILEKYMNGYTVPQGESINLKQLSGLMNQFKLTPEEKKSLASELFNYIFKGKADISDLINAVVSGAEPNPAYLKANYQIYQAESVFDGMMLINFRTQSLKYFVDPTQMANEIYAFNIYLISSNSGFQARQILAQVTLKPIKEPKAAPAVVKKTDKKVSAKTIKSSPAVTAPKTDLTANRDQVSAQSLPPTN
jgi:hypothetical protein